MTKWARLQMSFEAEHTMWEIEAVPQFSSDFAAVCLVSYPCLLIQYVIHKSSRLVLTDSFVQRKQGACYSHRAE